MKELNKIFEKIRKTDESEEQNFPLLYELYKLREKNEKEFDKMIKSFEDMDILNKINKIMSRGDKFFGESNWDKYLKKQIG